MFLAVNKETPSVLAKSLDSIITIDDDGTGRLGNIVGRNDWMDYHHGILASSFFYPAHVYALYASLRTGKELSASDIQKHSGYELKLQHTGERFRNPNIQAEYVRHTSHEMYQIIMRLACRKNPEAEVHVVAMIPCFEVLHALSKVLTGFKVHSDSGFDYVNILLNSKERIKNKDVYKGMHLSDGGDDRKKMRTVMKLFGWNKKKNGHYWYPPESGDHKDIVKPDFTKKND